MCRKVSLYKFKRQNIPRRTRSQKCGQAGIKSTVLFISWVNTLLACNYLGEKPNTHVELSIGPGRIIMVAFVQRERTHSKKEKAEATEAHIDLEWWPVGQSILFKG